MRNYGTLLFEPEPDPSLGGGGGEGGGEPEWSGVSQEQWQTVEQGLGRMQEFFDYIDSLENQPQPNQQPQQEQFVLDPLSDTFQEDLDKYIESRLQPHNEYLEQQSLSEGEQRAMDILADFEASQGDFLIKAEKEGDPDSRTMARQIAEAFLPEAQARFGYGPKAAEAALERAYTHMKSYEEAVGKAYHERKMNEMGSLAERGRRRELPAAGSQGAQAVNLPEGGNERDLVASYFPPPSR